jgi:hypothetical protein
MYRFRSYMLLALYTVAFAACTFESQRNGDHGVALEDTTLMPADSTAAAEIPAVLESATSR